MPHVNYVAARLATLREQMDRERHGAEVAEKQAKAAHHKKLEELRQQHASEKDTAEAAWAVAKAETQQQWLSALHNLQQKGADQLASQLATSTQVGGACSHCPELHAACAGSLRTSRPGAGHGRMNALGACSSDPTAASASRLFLAAFLRDAVAAVSSC